MTPTEELLAIENIPLLKARYSRLLDSHDWVGFRALFADDAVSALAKPPVAEGAADVFEKARRSWGLTHSLPGQVPGSIAHLT